MPRFRLSVRKERIGFSAAHFTVFPDGRAERLHGHNYRTKIEIEGEALREGLLLDFGEIKEAARQACAELDGRTLLPTRHPDLEIREQSGSVEARYGDRVYRFPNEDVRLLPVANTTVEELARHLALRILENLGSRLRDAGVARLRVGVEESPGQCGEYQEAL